MPGREREALVQAAKMAAAAAIAWLVTRLFPSPESFMAPYTAVFLMSATVYRSMLEAARQTITVLLGLLLAYLAASLIPQPVLALAAAVFVGMLVGQWHRLGASGIWVGVTALLMLTYGTADHGRFLLERMAETLLGAAVGVAVNMLILPPVHLRGAQEAVGALAGEIRRLLCSMADGLTDDWDTETARSWLRRARRLDQTVSRAESATSWGRESTRFNIRWRYRYRSGLSPLPSAYESPMATLGEICDQVRHIAEAIVTAGHERDGDGGNGGGPLGMDPEFTGRLRGVLERIADAVSCYERSPDQRASALPGLLDDIRAQHRHLVDHSREPGTPTANARLAQDAALHAVINSVRTLAEAEDNPSA